MKNLIKKYFSTFVTLYSYLKYRLFVVFILSLITGILDGFGLTMFIPMLNQVSTKIATNSTNQMGNLSFIENTIAFFGFNMTLSVVLFTMLLFFSLKGIFKFLEGYKKVVYRQYFIRTVREQNIMALSNYSYTNFVAADVGRIQNTMTTETERVGQGFNFYMLTLQQGVLLLVYIGLAFTANAEFSLLVLLGGLFTNLIFSKLFKITKQLSKKLSKSNSGFQGLIIQQVQQFKYLKATGLIEDYAKKLIKGVYKIEYSQRKIGILNAIMESSREPILMAVVVTVILIQVHFLGGSLGPIILSILFFYRALSAVMQVQTAWNKFLELSGSFSNLLDFTTELKKGKEHTGNDVFKAFQDKIFLNKVGFSYNNKHILSDINLQISKNETIAFVGESGSGKTTLLNIISGILPPNAGEFLIDGTNINEYNTSTYQKKIGYITQEAVIFNDTIFNNVTFWDEHTTDNKTRFNEALRKASIYDFVYSQPDAENTLLGNNGINISGGQKQRISIARELYKNVDLLLLDEATSALDTETEKEIQQSINNLKGKYTIIIIAHRLSTIKEANRIVFLKSGKIVNIGSYDELLHTSKDFHNMVKVQEI